jgi:hypothetical protein
LVLIVAEGTGQGFGLGHSPSLGAAGLRISRIGLASTPWPQLRTNKFKNWFGRHPTLALTSARALALALAPDLTLALALAALALAPDLGPGGIVGYLPLVPVQAKN